MNELYSIDESKLSEMVAREKEIYDKRMQLYNDKNKLNTESEKVDQEINKLNKSLFSLFNNEKIRKLQQSQLTRQIKMEEIQNEINKLIEQEKEFQKTHPRIIRRSDLTKLFNVDDKGFENIRRDFRFFGIRANDSCRISLKVDYLYFIQDHDLLISKLINHLSVYRQKVLDRVIIKTLADQLSINLNTGKDNSSLDNLNDFYMSVNNFLKEDLIIFSEDIDRNKVGIILKENLLESLKQYFEEKSLECIIGYQETPLFGYYYDIMIIKQLNKSEMNCEVFGERFDFCVIEFKQEGSCTFGNKSFYNPQNDRIYLDTAFYKMNDVSNPKAQLLQNDERLLKLYGHFTDEEISAFIKKHLLVHEMAHFIFRDRISKKTNLESSVYSEVFARLVGLLYCDIPYYDIVTYDSMSSENPIYRYSHNILDGYFRKCVPDFINFNDLVERNIDKLTYLPYIIRLMTDDLKLHINKHCGIISYLENWSDSCIYRWH